MNNSILRFFRFTFFNTYFTNILRYINSEGKQCLSSNCIVPIIIGTREEAAMKRQIERAGRRSRSSEPQDKISNRELRSSKRDYETIYETRMKNESVNANTLDYVDEGIGEDTENSNDSFKQTINYNEVDSEEEDTNDEKPALKLAATYLENEESKEFQCSRCNYISTKRGNVIRHISGVHQNPNKSSYYPEKCGTCGYRSTGKSVDHKGRPNNSLKDHQCHEKPIQCIKCDFHTTKNSEWERHALKHLTSKCN